MSAARPVPILGTHREPWPGSSRAGDLDLTREILLTAWLRPKRGGELDANAARTLGATPPSKRAYVDRAKLARETDVDPGDVALFRSFCAQHKISVEEAHWRSLVLSGTIEHFIDAFGATVATHVDAGKRRFRHRSGGLHAPPEIAAITRGVFGLHQWPRAVTLRQLRRHATPLTAAQVAARYDFPDADGSGQTIGILQCRAQFKAADFERCMRAQGITTQQPTTVLVDDAVVKHENETSSDLEAALDTQIAAALAPGARIVIYEGPNDERGFLDVVRKAIFDSERAISILSISYGWPEMLWTPATLRLLDELFAAAALVGVSVFCSSGDNGAELDYDGQPHVLAPASSPFAIGCGATTIDRHGQESAWAQTGGGFSTSFPVQSWHDAVVAHAGSAGAEPGRGVPDVAAQEGPGYTVYVDGVELAMGGTSAVAPVWAALTARINQRLERPAGFFAPLLYRHAAGCGEKRLFRDVTSGGNDRYKARAGWNPCTGLGVPVGSAIEEMLRA